MELVAEWVKVYGGWALGWVAFAALGKFFLENYREDVQSRVQLAVALNSLADLIRGMKK